MDFTVKKYTQLIQSLVDQNYEFITYEDYILQRNKTGKYVMLRHDVDAKKLNSLRFAEIQNSFNIRGTYYFRDVPASYDEDVILKIKNLGHEIGYHYETMDTANGNIEQAYDQFKNILAKFRKLAPITTICMHGSPLSKFDNKDIWSRYDYKKLDLIGEPYYDTDFSTVYYITDTGRKWDGGSVSVRDKVESPFSLKFHATDEVIQSVQSGQFPDKVMFTFHPQRWNDNLISWLLEITLQNTKNLVKKMLIQIRSK